MGRLFWKIFCAFVLMLLAVGLGVGTTVWFHQRNREAVAVDVAIGPRSALLVNAAGSALKHAGTPALVAMLTDWVRVNSGRPPLLAVDDAGGELLGRPVPAAALTRARALLASESRETQRLVVVRSVAAPDGQRWLLFIAAPPDAGPPPPGPRPRGLPWPMIGLALIASLVASAALAWYLAKPIRLLRAGFEAVAKGDLDTRLQARMGGRRDEIADLGRDFDRMVGHLQSVLAGQRQLLHDVSHELRSPLARLQAAVGLARQSPQRQQASLERIEREAVRLDELVGEVLALSRLQTERPSEPLERADLNELVRAIADDARFEAQTDRRDVVLETGAPLPLTVRRELLQRAVENVIRNAVKFTAPDTCVDVRVRREHDQAVVEVDDRGPGVAEDELEAIFEPFHRGRQANGTAGFGLGLAIARRAVQAHHGQVEASARPGGGLRIRITLPIAP